MKKLLLIVALFSITTPIFAQKAKTDSLLTIYKYAHDDKERLQVLKKIVSASGADFNAVIQYSKQGLELAKKSGSYRDQLAFLSGLQSGYLATGNFSKQLETCFEGLELSRELKKDSGTVFFLNMINTGYLVGKEPRKAIPYGLAGLNAAEKIHYTKLIGGLLNNTSRAYKEVGELDSALYFMQRAYTFLANNHSPIVGLPLEGLAEIHQLMHHDTVALSYHRKAAIQFKTVNDQGNLGYTYTNMANIFYKYGRRDSAMYYAKLGFDIGQKVKELTDITQGGFLLSTLYDGVDDKQSLRYYKIAVAARDSANNTEKVKELQLTTIKEQQRQTELAEKKLKEEEENRQNLQLMVIAFFIPIFILLVLLLSRTRTHRRLIDFLGVLSILLLFEFITLVLHPQIEKLTHHTPILELLISVAVAAILVPLHHTSTHWLKTKLSGHHHQNQTSPSA